MNNQKKLIIMVITLSLILVLSSSYALLRSTKVSKNSYSISIGDLEVTFIDSQTEKLNLSNMYPMSDEEGESQEKTLTFTVENTGTVVSYYDISIEELSTNPEFKSVIKYISNKDEEGYKAPKILSENKYIELTGYIEPKQTSTYKVKVWLMEEADNTYMGKEFKAKIKINAYQESSYAKDVIKSKLVKYEESSKEGFQGGLVAVNTNGELYNETDEIQAIREYRYSGPSVNNYVTFNNETWRILGVFKDENNEEHLKLVRNETLLRTVMPATYAVNEEIFKIQADNSSINRGFWNRLSSDSPSNFSNNWAEAGLMYWLNSRGTDNNDIGYLKTLTSTAQNMIAETKYYLWTLTYDKTYYIKETPIEAYNNERAVTGCTENKGKIENNNQSAVEGNNTCRVWANNAATWTGKIGLMYPSDVGFSTIKNYWKTMMGYNSFNENASNSSWLQKEANLTSYEWFLSPTSFDSHCVTTCYSEVYLYSAGAGLTFAVCPTLYLKSDVKITGGTGEQLNPYILSEN